MYKLVPLFIVFLIFVPSFGDFAYAEEVEPVPTLFATGTETVETVEVEPAQTEKDSQTPRDSAESRDDENGLRHFGFPSLIVLFVIIFGLYIYKTKGRRNNKK